MTVRNLGDRWASWGPRLLSLLRIVAAFMFILAGTMKLFAFPIGVPPHGSTVPLMTQIGIGGVLEALGGALLLLGLYTRPVAFILAGEMAVAYFMAHMPQDFFPVNNGGDGAVLFCFVFLYLVFSGPGAWSIDGQRSATA